jgi:hypothetical protein
MLAIKDDVFECGTTTSAGQFKKSNKAIMKDQRNLDHGGFCGANYCSATAASMDRGSHHPGVMIDNQASIFMRQSTLQQVPICQVNLTEGLVTAYTIYLDQCSLTGRSKLEQLPEWPQISQDKDPLHLKNKIRNIMCSRESHQEPTYSMVQLIKLLVNLMQDNLSKEP